MNTINSVFAMAKTFMTDPKYVTINEERVEEIAELMKDEGKIDFFKEKGATELFQGVNFTDEIKLELLASSINYCYWYGRHDMRPGGASSTLMYALVSNEYSLHNRVVDMKLIDNIVGLLAEYRFPLIEDRAKHLVQTATRWNDFINKMLENKEEVGPLMDQMVRTFPGFASDMFLKRAALFFIQLSRKFEWYKETIKDIHVPVDYHLPNILKYYGCLKYDFFLQDKIDNHDLISRGSLIECEIRSATVLACRKLAELTEWLPPEVDTWFWTKRSECTDPFHLTITTDY